MGCWSIPPASSREVYLGVTCWYHADVVFYTDGLLASTGPGLGGVAASSAAECCSICSNATMQKLGCKGWSYTLNPHAKGKPAPPGTRLLLATSTDTGHCRY